MKANKLFDLCECYSSVNANNTRIERHISTIAYNLPYRMQERKRQILAVDPRYPRGTFFVITENGKAPELNKHLKKPKLHEKKKSTC